LRCLSPKNFLKLALEEDFEPYVAVGDSLLGRKPALSIENRLTLEFSGGLVIGGMGEASHSKNLEAMMERFIYRKSKKLF